MVNPTIRGLYCLRCSSRKVVRGTFEAARFYPQRGLIRSLLGRPVRLSQPHAHACMDCGLTWTEVEPNELRKNLREYGIAAHSTGVMQAIKEGPVDVAL